MLNWILGMTSAYHPQVYMEPCDEYPTLKYGDYVIRYNDQLALIYEKGFYQVCYEDWIGNFRNPIPLLLLILSGNVRLITENEWEMPVLVIKEDTVLEQPCLQQLPVRPAVLVDPE